MIKDLPKKWWKSQHSPFLVDSGGLTKRKRFYKNEEMKNIKKSSANPGLPMVTLSTAIAGSHGASIGKLS